MCVYIYIYIYIYSSCYSYNSYNGAPAASAHVGLEALHDRGTNLDLLRRIYTII